MIERIEASRVGPGLGAERSAVRIREAASSGVWRFEDLVVMGWLDGVSFSDRDT